jgi:hypothetical protein
VIQANLQKNVNSSQGIISDKEGVRRKMGARSFFCRADKKIYERCDSRKHTGILREI